MKKHARRLSILLTFALIMTYCLTGVFAVDELTAEPETPQAEQVEEQPAEPEQITEEPAPEDVVDTEIPANPDAADPEQITEELAEGAAEEEADAESLEAGAPEAANAATDDASGYTIKWVLGKETKESKVAANEVPVYDGTPVPEGYDEIYIADKHYKFTGWTDGENTYGPEDPLPAATADATYTAQFKSLRVEPKKPKFLKNENNMAFASYKSVWIEMDMDAVKDINGYEYDDDVQIRFIVKPRKNKSLNSKEQKQMKQKNVQERYHSPKVLKPFKTYAFDVYTMVLYEDFGKHSEAYSTIKGSPVASIRYRLNIKQGGTLTKHAGKGPRTYSLKSGQTIDTDRFQTGRYIFEYKGSIFYISKTRVSKATALYNKRGTWNYSAKEATYYVNDRGTNSKTNTMVFINTFCQHGYYFTRANKKSDWECTKNWECATGLASTPTPTGDRGEKYIHDHIRKKNGINYWNLFNGNAALHGTKPNDKRVGMVISNGCVRNPDKFAEYIYKNAKMKTKVLIV